MTFSELGPDQRSTSAQEMLTDARFGSLNISIVAIVAGFGDLSCFNRTFRRRIGMTPADLRQRRGDDPSDTESSGPTGA